MPNNLSWQKEIVEQVIRNNKELQQYEANNPGKTPLFTTDPELFYKGVKEEPKRNNILLRQDPITKLWGIVYMNRKNKDRLHYLSPTQATYNEESQRISQEIKDQGITDRILSGWGGYDMNKDKLQKYSLLWSLSISNIAVNNWNKPDNITAPWDDIKDESKWKSQISDQYNQLADDKLNQLTQEKQKIEQEKATLETQLTTAKETAETAKNNEAYLAIIKSYQDLINPWLTDLESKVKSEPLTQELLSIYRKETSYRLTLFYQEREIDDKIINQKYGGKSYETIVKQQLTLTNRRDMEDAFKVVTCICAYEKAEQMSNKLKEKGTHSEALIKPLLARLEKLKNTWLELPKTVKSENNPFYLKIIEDQSQYQAQVEQLITFWKQNKLENVQLQ
ncbi:MAG: hypothetical protein I3275_01730, partial [Candidatus Moeniiplasma glomeromycotorum]|nr:hypothetical protein [Candidatus Moeniiplasma glomeromycotorum]